MKKKLLFLFFVTTYAHAQMSVSPIEIKNKLIGEWVKKDIRAIDSSKIFNDKSIENDLRYIFRKDDSVRIVYNNATAVLDYKANAIDSLLVINTLLKYKITHLGDKYLILDGAIDDASLAIKIILQPASVHNVGFIPKFYVSKGNDTVYTAKRNYLEPLFTDQSETAMDFISSKFSFPEFKTGDFLARFVVTKEGKVRTVEILSSTHKKFDEDLIKAIKQTEGRWLPATWGGNPVNTEVEMGFDYGWAEKQRYKEEYHKRLSGIKEEKKEDTSLSARYFFEGNLSFDEKAYNRAIKMYSLCIENNHLNVDAYYRRAASYIALKQMNKACEDLLQLKHLEQKRGERLYLKYCSNLIKTDITPNN